MKKTELSVAIALCCICLMAIMAAVAMFTEEKTEEVALAVEIAISQPITPPTVEEYAIPEAERSIEIEYSIEAEYIAKTVWGEARGCVPAEQELVIWCILNRVDSDIPYFPNDIISVITQPSQFHGYDASNPVLPEIYDLSLNVLERWEHEKNGGEVTRTLAPEYLYFYGDGAHNYFRVEY